jgi:hypothetical protein
MGKCEWGRRLGDLGMLATTPAGRAGSQDPREASELLKQAGDILVLVAELTAPDNSDVG